MKPLNIITLKSSYMSFLTHFSLLILFTIICIFFYYQAKNVDFLLINKRLELINKQEEARKEVDAELLMIRAKLASISRTHSTDYDDLDNQYVALALVKEKSSKISKLLGNMDTNTLRYGMYQRLSEDLTPMVVMQDSLFTTRFEIQSIKDQLDVCLRTYNVAKSKLRGGLSTHAKR
jgi:hypothetical protein